MLYKLIGVEGRLLREQLELEPPQERQRRGGGRQARGKRPRNGNQFTVNAKN